MPGGYVQLFGIALLHCVISFFSGLCFFVVGYCVTFRTRENWKPLVVSLAFVGAEIFRSLIISILYLGDNTTIDLHFNAGTIGNALSTTPLVELAYLGGTFSLTLCLTYILVAFFVLSPKKVLAHTGLIVAIFLSIHFLIPIHAPTKDLTIGVVTTATRTQQDDTLAQSFTETNEAITSLVLGDQRVKDVIVFPEDARFLSSLSTSSKESLLRLHKNTLIIDGNTVIIDGKRANVSLFFTTADGKIKGRGKELLLPFNEYIPYVFRFIFGLIVGEQLEEYEKYHTYTPIVSGKTVLFEGTRVGTLICSETLSFRVIQKLKGERADVVFYQSRLNVFNDNPWFLMHLRSFSKVAAAQLRTTVIGSNNYAPSYIINSRGKIVGEIPLSVSYNALRLDEKGGVILIKD